MAETQVRNWIFDLGNVLLNWHPEPIVARLFPEIVDTKTYTKELFHHPSWQAFDRGDHSETEVCHMLSTHFDQPVERMQQLSKACAESLTAKPETIAFLHGLREQRYRLFCLSNMPVEFYDHLQQAHDFWHCFEHITISGHVNMIKPEHNIYHYVLETNQLQAHECVFLDDLAENIAAAEAVGIHGVQFTSLSHCLQELQQRQLWTN